MKKIAVCVAFIVAVGISQADLVHRYEFNGGVTDSVGSFNGTATGNTDNLEAPNFGTVTPGGASGPTQSIEFGMSDGTKKSGFTLSGNAIQNYAIAGSISMFVLPEATASSVYRYLFSALPAGGGFNIGQKTVGGNQVINSTVNNDPLGETAAITPGTWYHAALTWEQSGTDLTRTFYINGAVVATETITGSITGITQVRVGGFNFNNDAVNLGNQFDGRLYDVQIYDTTLSSENVSLLSNNPGSVIPEPATIGMLGLGAAVTLIVRHIRN
jgi:hypothetical protein